MTQSTIRTPDSQRQRDPRDEPYDRDDETTFDDPALARERSEERARAQARDGARERAQQATGDDAGADGSFGTSYLGDRSTEEPWQQWRQIQADFVDNPRSAVSKAHGLVGGLVDDIVHKFENERTQLESRWASGQDVSTEDLRTCLQTYRDFFGRLLATGEKEN